MISGTQRLELEADKFADVEPIIVDSEWQEIAGKASLIVHFPIIQELRIFPKIII